MKSPVNFRAGSVHRAFRLACAAALAILLVVPLAACANPEPPVVAESAKLGLSDQVRDGIAVDGANLYVRLAGVADYPEPWSCEIAGEGLALQEGPVVVNADSADEPADTIYHFVGTGEGKQTIQLVLGTPSQSYDTCTIESVTNVDGVVVSAIYTMKDGRTGSVSQ